jgi:Pyruvate/2-oxoacid:ferredoxin oxidoreductase delta subunit
VLDGRTLYRGWLSLAFGLVLAPVSLGYLLVGRPLLGKLFIADERCTSCGICAKTCPFGAIRMLGTSKARPYWTWDCESCMRCMNVCPESAIQAWQPGLAAITLISSFAAAPVAVVVATSGQLMSLAVLLGSWGIIYALLWRVSRYLPMAWLVGHTTFTRIYRRYHEPGSDLRKV